MINVKDITFDKLKSPLDIDIRDVLCAKSEIQIIEKYKMFIPGYPIPYINK